MTVADVAEAPQRPNNVRRRYVTPPEPRFFDQPTAAAYLGISERLFESLWRSYKIPYPRHLGRRVLWDRKLLDRWADVTSGIATAEPEREIQQDRKQK